MENYRCIIITTLISGLITGFVAFLIVALQELDAYSQVTHDYMGFAAAILSAMLVPGLISHCEAMENFSIITHKLIFIRCAISSTIAILFYHALLLTINIFK